MSTPAVSDNNAAFFQALVPGLPSAQLHSWKSFTGTASYTANLEAGTTLLGVFATQDCWLRLVESTSSDVATIPAEGAKSSTFFLPGGIKDFIGIPRKDGVLYKISVVRNASSGTLYLSEGA